MTPYHKSTTATFKPVAPALARRLLDFASRRNLGKTVEIDGVAYTLDHISQSTSAYWRSRGFSVYFRTGRSVIRISDHWSASSHAERSRKLNCGMVDSCEWTIENRAFDIFEAHAPGCGRHPYRLIAGRCGLAGFRRI